MNMPERLGYWQDADGTYVKARVTATGVVWEPYAGPDPDDDEVFPESKPQVIETWPGDVAA